MRLSTIICDACGTSESAGKPTGNTILTTEVVLATMPRGINPLVQADPDLCLGCRAALAGLIKNFLNPVQEKEPDVR